ncbi:MAG: DUF4433 domain-containing protein [Thiohalospira sp.]
MGKITCPSHKEADVKYQGIGNESLIGSRKIRAIQIEPFGTFNDYVSFYFGSRSPMLYSIKNGYNGVTKRSQAEIIYLIVTFESVKNMGLKYVFFDGHGYHNFSRVYNTETGLGQIDWNAVNTKQWSDTEDDPDKKRRKQAEFLIHNEVPVEVIASIGVYNEEVKKLIESLLERLNISIKVFVFNGGYY